MEFLPLVFLSRVFDINTHWVNTIHWVTGVPSTLTVSEIINIFSCLRILSKKRRHNNNNNLRVSSEMVLLSESVKTSESSQPKRRESHCEKVIWRRFLSWVVKFSSFFFSIRLIPSSFSTWPLLYHLRDCRLEGNYSFQLIRVKDVKLHP
jgi:hypothetical protein